jgi:hypothetical protein
MTDNTPAINDFLPSSTDDVMPAVVVKNGAKRKRKAIEDKDGLDELKRQARLYCKCPEQWRSVSRYAPKRLAEFCQEQQFSRDQQMYDNIFDAAHHMYAFAMDKLSRGNGYVENDLKSDVSLRECIEVELMAVCRFLTNRWKFMALSSIDIANAKRRQWIECPTPVLVEEINGDDADSCDQDRDVEHVAEPAAPVTRSDFTGDDATPADETTAQEEV